MRRRNLNRVGVLGLSLVALGFGLAGSAAGCGDSEPNKGTTPPGADGSTPGEDGSTTTGDSATSGVTIDIVVSSSTVYAGQKAQLIASQSKASNGETLNFGWAVKTVPAGSGITSSSIQGSNELVSLVPDLAGDYVITVTATTGATTATKDVTVKAVNAPVFYLRTTSGERIDDLGYEMRTVQMDGTGDHAVACRQQTFKNLPANLVNDSGVLNLEDAGDGGLGMIGIVNYMVLGLFADQAIDWWEAPAGEASRAAFQNTQILGADAGPDAANTQVSLLVATQDNTCQTPPFAARVFQGRSGDGMFNPKFSPDGRRIAFIERKGDTGVLITTAIDGSDAREIGPVCEDGTSTCFSQKYIFPRRPQWIDETHVGWLRTTTSTDTSVGWEVVVAADIPNAPISRYITCSSGTAPLLFNFLRDGNILANVSATKKGPENLLVMGRSAGGACQVLRNLTNFTKDGSYARDFAISPDGTQVAYVHKVGTGIPQDAGQLDIRQGGELYSVPLDGTQAPAPIGPIPRGANYGPRWIAGGTRLVWNGMAPPPPGYEAGLPVEDDAAADAAASFFEAGLPAVTVMQADGGGYMTVAFGDPLQGSYVLGGGNGGSCSLECTGLACQPPSTCGPQGTCAVVEKRNGEGPTFWASMFGLALLLRRARRPKRD